VTITQIWELWWQVEGVM